MHKTCITCSVLRATGVNCFSPYGYKAFLVLAAAFCSTSVCRLAGMYAASFNCPEIPARLETLDSRKKKLILDPNLPLLRPAYYLGHSAVHPQRGGEVLPEQGVRGQCHKAISVPPHSCQVLPTHAGKVVFSHNSHRPELALCIRAEMKSTV